MAQFTNFKFSNLFKNPGNLEFHVEDNLLTSGNTHGHCHYDFFCILIVLKADIKMKIDLEDRIISDNSLVIFSPNSIPEHISYAGEVKLYKIFFTSNFLQQIGIQNYEIDNFNFMVRSPTTFMNFDVDGLHNLVSITKSLKKTYDSIGRHPYAESIIQHEFKILLLELDAIGIKTQLSNTVIPSRKRDLAAQFNNLIQNYFREQRTVKFYAAKLSITPKYLSEVIHEMTGKSPSDLIDQKVIHETKILLRNPRLSIAQIADALNFSDQSFLGKFFKKHSGLSPSQYRNNTQMFEVFRLLNAGN